MIMFAIFSAIAAFFVVAERLFAARPQALFRSGLVTDGLYVISNIALRWLITGQLALAVSYLGHTYLPEFSVGVLLQKPVWAQAIGIILILDFFFYWMHRAKHRWQWWWRLHETHHSPREMDWFSSVRFHPLEKVLDRTIYLFPLLFLGATEEALLVLATVDALAASFSHANLNWRIGPLIYVINGPEMHRWHHTRDPATRECNFGNNLSIFDWIFGTAFLTKENPRHFGVSDDAYPEGNILKQFAYAFRPFDRPHFTPLRRQPGES